MEVVVNDDGGGGEYGDDEEGADEDVFVLALELADNLAHDKVTVVPSEEGRGESSPWRLLESVVVDGKREGARPLKDPLLVEALRICWPTLVQPIIDTFTTAPSSSPRSSSSSSSSVLSSALSSLKTQLLGRLLGVSSGGGGGGMGMGMGGSGAVNATFVPTGAHLLFRELRAAFPRGHTLLLADFDALPPPELSTAYAATEAEAEAVTGTKPEADGSEEEEELAGVLFPSGSSGGREGKEGVATINRWLGGPLEAMGAPIVSSREGAEGGTRPPHLLAARGCVRQRGHPFPVALSGARGALSGEGPREAALAAAAAVAGQAAGAGGGGGGRGDGGGAQVEGVLRAAAAAAAAAWRRRGGGGGGDTGRGDAQRVQPPRRGLQQHVPSHWAEEAPVEGRSHSKR